MVAEGQRLPLVLDLLVLIRLGSAEGVPAEGRRAFLLAVVPSVWVAVAQSPWRVAASGFPQAHSQGRPSLAQVRAL